MNRKLRKTWRQLGIPADYSTQRRLPIQREARALVSVGRNPDRRIVRLAPLPAAAWRRMKKAARFDGIELQAISGYRSIARQIKIIRGKLARHQKITDILRYVAAPGCSEHQTGRALDLSSPGEPPLEERFARTAAFRWLKRRAAKFGFRLSYPRRNPHRLGYEPWHWCWHRTRRSAR